MHPGSLSGHALPFASRPSMQQQVVQQAQGQEHHEPHPRQQCRLGMLYCCWFRVCALQLLHRWRPAQVFPKPTGVTATSQQPVGASQCGGNKCNTRWPQLTRHGSVVFVLTVPLKEQSLLHAFEGVPSCIFQRLLWP